MKIAAAAAFAALLLVLPASTAVGFTPKALAGTWNGSWLNETFGSTGPAKFVVTAANKNTKLTFSYDVGGNVFGCPDPAPGSGALTKGAGANHWNAAGFVVKRSTPEYGATTFVYTHANKKLRGNGTVGTCNPGLKWQMDGAFAGATFAGTFSITFADGSTATSKLTLTRA